MQASCVWIFCTHLFGEIFQGQYLWQSLVIITTFKKFKTANAIFRCHKKQENKGLHLKSCIIFLSAAKQKTWFLFCLCFNVLGYGIYATARQRANWKIAGAGYGIHWPDIRDCALMTKISMLIWFSITASWNAIFWLTWKWGNFHIAMAMKKNLQIEA